MRFQTVQKKFPGCHVECARNALKLWEYCGKVESRIGECLSYGIPPAAKNVKGDTQKRNEMIIEHGVIKAVEQGIIPIEKFKQVKQSLDLFRITKNTFSQLDSLDNEWHYGATGTGKSRGVRAAYPDAYIKGNNIWWDGYNGEEVVIIEELGPKQIGSHHLKQWADHYPFSAESKGASCKIRPKKIVITSNYHPNEIWFDTEKEIEPILRRFQLHHYPVPIIR